MYTAHFIDKICQLISKASILYCTKIGGGEERGVGGEGEAGM